MTLRIGSACRSGNSSDWWRPYKSGTASACCVRAAIAYRHRGRSSGSRAVVVVPVSGVGCLAVLPLNPLTRRGPARTMGSEA